jgi:hypothetical protein
MGNALESKPRSRMLGPDICWLLILSYFNNFWQYPRIYLRGLFVRDIDRPFYSILDKSISSDQAAQPSV